MPRGGDPTKDYISPSDTRLGRKIHRKLSRSHLSIDDVRLGGVSAEYWWENVKTLQRYSIGGDHSTVAVLDTGCAKAQWDRFNVDRSRSIDLSGEGLQDDRSHGTVVSALINLVAPGCRQYVVKLFPKGSDPRPERMLERIAAGLAHVERIGASCVNASWNKLTYPAGHDQHARPGHFCKCSLCSIISSFVERTGITVIVSEGNYRYDGGEIRTRWSRPDGTWTCPTSANYVTPVIARRGDADFYNNNFNPTYAIPAPGGIAIATPPSLMERLSGRSGFEELSGSSFAAPLVSGTYALLLSALMGRGYPRRPVPPRNIEFERGKSRVSFNFPIELFFVPPDHRHPEEQRRHGGWAIVYANARTAIDGLDKQGRRDDAGELCCLFADLMRTAYLRMQGWVLEEFIAERMLALYAAGLELLLQTNLAIGCDVALANALSATAVAKSRGYDVSQVEPQLKAMNSFFQRNRLQLLLRLDGGEWEWDID